MKEANLRAVRPRSMKGQRAASSKGMVVDHLKSKYNVPRPVKVEERIKRARYELAPKFWGKPEFEKDYVGEVLNDLPHIRNRVAA